MGSKAGNRAVEGRAADRVGRHRHLGAGAERAQLLLRHLKIDIDRIELLERERRPVLRIDVLADIHLPYADAAVIGRADRLLVDDRLLLVDLRADVVEVGERAVVIGLGDRVGFDQGRVARIGLLRQDGAGAECGELGAVGVVAQLHQKCAGAVRPDRPESRSRSPSAA